MLLVKIPFCYRRFFFRKLVQKYLHSASNYTTLVSIDAVDALTNELLQRHRQKIRNNPYNMNDLSLRFFMKSDSEQKKDISSMSPEEIENYISELLEKSRHKQITGVIEYCNENKISLCDNTIKKAFRNASMNGKVDTVQVLQKYTIKLNPFLHKRNGEFLHYVAKAQCMKGNSEKGLFILKQCYSKYEGLRSFYRIIFRELIQDSVSNRSEASLVVFKKYVLEFSERFKDHYPLVCFWHICWSSSWFSDQMLADELLEASKDLQAIVKDKATAFSITVLRECNDEAVTKLLQSLLKYKMMDEYVKVLQVLFAYKLRNRDLQGCTEIVRNCETLGLSLPSNQQGKYIKMLINNSEGKPTPKPNFKLKF